MPRLGLCCKFLDEPIRFRTTTATSTAKLSRRAALDKLAGLCRHNAKALTDAIDYCARKGIGAFRVNSRILPLKTHPDLGHAMSDLPGGDEIVALFESSGRCARTQDVRLTFHPDQFVLLSSPREDVTVRSVEELEYQAEVASWIGADAINIHGGGAYDDKAAALRRFAKNFKSLSKGVRCRLTLENDDRIYTPSELLPVCDALGIPLVYDIHHHRCLPDALGEEDATALALETWNREPIFHISSPRGGWCSAHSRHHRDMIRMRDFPDCWRDLDITIDVEAKAKERAVIALRRSLSKSALLKK